MERVIRTRRAFQCIKIVVEVHLLCYRSSLDSDCKKWRLFADVINDIAMFLELTVPLISTFSLQVLCVTSTMKALVNFQNNL